MKTVLKRFAGKHMTSILIGCLIVSAMLITYGMVHSIETRLSGYMLDPSTKQHSPDDVRPVSADEQYIVREYEGRIGVFVPDDTHPIRVEAVYVMYLPEGDRIKLRDGIIVNGKMNLETLLNDFSS